MLSRILIAILGLSSTVVTWSPRYFSDAEMVVWVDPSNTYTMFQQSTLTGIGLTVSDDNAEKVGQIYDSGPNALMLYALSDAGRPALASDGSMNSYLDFDGSTSVMRFSPSSKLFAGFLSGFTSGSGIQPVFTIAFKIKKDTDGTIMSIMDNNDHSTTGSGFNIYLDASNHVVLRFNSINTPFPVSSIAYTTTEDITVAEGWTNVIIEANQQGTGTGKIIIDGVEETFNVNGGAGSATVSPELTIGRRATTADRYFDGGITQILVINRVLTSDEIDYYEAYNPARTSTTFTKLEAKYDFNDTSRGYADASKTTPITNTVAARAWENSVRQNFKSQNTNSPNFKDQTTSATSNTWPIFQTSVQNGKNALQFDGVNDNLDFNEKFPGYGGRHTIVFIGRNVDSSFGSRWVNDAANNYFVYTGSNYPGNDDRNGNEYCAVHMQGMAETVAVDLANQGDAWNIVVIRFDLSSVTVWNGDKVSETATLTTGSTYSDMGQNALSDWWAQGWIGLFEDYQGAMTTRDIEDLIDERNAEYGL